MFAFSVMVLYAASVICGGFDRPSSSITYSLSTFRKMCAFSVFICYAKSEFSRQLFILSWVYSSIISFIFYSSASTSKNFCRSLFSYKFLVGVIVVGSSVSSLAALNTCFCSKSLNESTSTCPVVGFTLWTTWFYLLTWGFSALLSTWSTFAGLMCSLECVREDPTCQSIIAASDCCGRRFDFNNENDCEPAQLYLLM